MNFGKKVEVQKHTFVPPILICTMDQPTLDCLWLKAVAREGRGRETPHSLFFFLSGSIKVNEVSRPVPAAVALVSVGDPTY